MAESKHTPGPWPYKHTGDGKRIVIGDGLVDGPNGYEVAEVYSDDCDQEEAEANARLIAAAPDLLAALKEFVHPYQSGELSEGERRNMALSAIAKAEGWS